MYCLYVRQVAASIGIFQWHNPSGCTMALGSIQPLTEMSTRCISGGWRRPVLRLTILLPSCAAVMKFGNLNFLEPSGPLQAYNGAALPLPLLYVSNKLISSRWVLAFCNSHYLFTLLSLSKQTRLTGIEFPSISFCLYVVALNVYRASNVWGHQLPCAPVAVWRSISNGWPAALNEARRSVSMLMKRPNIPRIGLNTVHLYQHYSLFMHNKLQYTWRGDYCERVQPAQIPVLTWSWSSVPPGISYKIRSPPGPRRIQNRIP
jgi:hypothetical protein